MYQVHTVVNCADGSTTEHLSPPLSHATAQAIATAANRGGQNRATSTVVPAEQTTTSDEF